MTDATRADARGLADDVLQGGGDMGALMRATDWTTTPLGPVSGWPQSLRTTVSTCLCSRFPILVWWGPALVMLYNDAYTSVLGSKHPAALGAAGREVWPEIWDIIGPMLNGVLERSEATWSEDQLLMLERHGYPEECYFTFSYSPVRDESGGVGGVFTAVTETTERVVGERRLATLRALAECSAGADSPAEAADRCVRALREDSADVPFALFYMEEDDTAGTPWPVAQVLQGGHSARVDTTAPQFGVLPSGRWSEPPSEAIVLPVPGATQEQTQGALVVGLSPHRWLDDDYRSFLELAAGHIGTAVSQARAHEVERRRLEELAALDRAKTVFFSNVSHEFRTPLTLMMAPLQELLGGNAHDVEDDRARRHLLEMAYRNSLRLLKLVNSLLDFARIEAGRLDAHFEPTDFAAYSAELASAFRSTIERAGVRLTVNAPVLREPVYLDRDLWEKVVLNLVSNAFKHTFSGEIAVSVREQDKGAELVVRDTGVGIPADQLLRVFERFHRVASARARTHEGAGIGLALVQELARLHGGTIRLESEVGKGTTATVWIPFGRSHLPEERVGVAPQRADVTPTLDAYLNEASGWNVSGEQAPARSAEREADSSRQFAGARVIVVDDNVDMSDYVSRLLRERGCEVETASDGRVALEMARARAPDLVVSDVMMPGLDGFALLHALRADSRTSAVPVILLSARAGEEARVEGLSAGADDYVVKPFSARELVTRVESHLQRALQLNQERRVSSEHARAYVLAETERERLRELFLQSPAAIAVVRGPDHVYELTNPPYRRFLGGRNVIGKPIRDALPELEGQGVFELLDEVYRTGEPIVVNELGVWLDVKGAGTPEEIFFNFVYQPIRERGAGGEMTSGIFIQAVDVSEQVRARRTAEALQRDSERARTDAEAASRAKSDFLAAMSHELRTPLNAIAGYAQLLLMELHGPITPAQRDALQRVERSQRHLLRLINEVLNLARVESGRLDYDIHDFPVQQAVAELGPMVQPQFDAKGVTYEVRLPAEPVMVRADRDKMTQILINLLANAVKFTPSGGRVTIEVAQRAGVSATFIRVTDTGVGIPRDKQSQIFEPFVQVHTGHTRQAEGAGLGLAISYDLAKAMGGDLRVRSEEGKGACFTLSLPKGES